MGVLAEDVCAGYLCTSNAIWFQTGLGFAAVRLWGYFSSCESVDVLLVAPVLVTDDQPCTAPESPPPRAVERGQRGDWGACLVFVPSFLGFVFSRRTGGDSSLPARHFCLLLANKIK